MKANRLLTVLSIHVGIVLSGMALDASAQQANAMASGQMSKSAAKMETPAQAGGPLPASTQAFKNNAAKMMKNMSTPGYTGDTDADFVAHVIPHHQGAVDQAEVELKYGDDPQMRALAKNIIEAQKEEIAFMKRWQARHDTNM
ncbi:CopM family metallochaperone [Paraburkholderia sediminicola]|uniref:CopM family metallochaperone n=1 Tax=Paraburkholderia sediminicola TaxID=458836 RepID=UPI0038BD6598